MVTRKPLSRSEPISILGKCVHVYCNISQPKQVVTHCRFHLERALERVFLDAFTGRFVGQARTSTVVDWSAWKAQKHWRQHHQNAALASHTGKCQVLFLWCSKLAIMRCNNLSSKCCSVVLIVLTYVHTGILNTVVLHALVHLSWECTCMLFITIVVNLFMCSTSPSTCRVSCWRASWPTSAASSWHSTSTSLAATSHREHSHQPSPPRKTG